MDGRTVMKGHQASYQDPIRVKQGDAVSLTGREDVWDGHRWLWAVAADGREGWIPDDLIVEDGEPPRAARDYSAVELTCRAGESVEVRYETHGWGWCRNSAGREGWVPMANLSEQ